MATGYEVQYYRHIEIIAESLKRIADALEAKNISEGVDE